MRGFKYSYRGYKMDMVPCFFCKHRNSDTYLSPCCDCISNEDIMLHKSNFETEFTGFSPLSQEHLKVLKIESEVEK